MTLDFDPLLIGEQPGGRYGPAEQRVEVLAQDVLGSQIDAGDHPVQITGDQAAGYGLHDVAMDDLQVGQVQLFFLQLTFGSRDVLSQACRQVGDGVEAEDVGYEVVEQLPGWQSIHLADLFLRPHGYVVDDRRKGSDLGFCRWWYPAEVERYHGSRIQEAGE